METFKASSQGFDAFVSLSKGEDITKDQFLEKIDGMYPKMAKHVKSQWKRLGGKWAVCQAVITRDQRDMIRDVLGSNVGKDLSSIHSRFLKPFSVSHSELKRFPVEICTVTPW